MIETVKERPDFNKKGFLLHKCYELTLMEIKNFFVDSCPKSDTRQTRFICFSEFLRFFLDNFDFVEKGFIFGSFVKMELNPRDVDVLLVMDDERSREYPLNVYLYDLEQDVAKIKNEFNLMEYEESLSSDFFDFGCDFHYLYRRDEAGDKELYEDYLEKKKFWCGFISENNEIGYISFPIEKQEFEEIL